MQRAALMVRLKRLKFADRQAQLQMMVEREQSELMAMTDRAYRAVARQCVRQRLDKMRAVSYMETGNPSWRMSGTLWEFALRSACSEKYLSIMKPKLSAATK